MVAQHFARRPIRRVEFFREIPRGGFVVVRASAMGKFPARMAAVGQELLVVIRRQAAR